jgi:hypothetical protein
LACQRVGLSNIEGAEIMHLSFFKNRIEIGLSLLLVAFIVLSLMPLLSSGYFNDDAISSQISYILKSENKTLLAYTFEAFWGWVKTQGRFYPLACYNYLIFLFLPLLTYKLTILLFVLFDVFLFGYLIKLMTNSRALAFLAMLMTPAFFQFRLINDPILSYHFLLQILFGELMISLIFFHKFLVEPKRSLMIISLIAYGMTALTYEISYLFFILHFLLAWEATKDLKKSIKSTWPFGALTGVMIIVSLLLRSHAAAILTPYQIHFEAGLYIKTVLRQVFAAFPLCYFMKDTARLFNLKRVFGVFQWQDIIMVGLAIYLFVITTKESFKQINAKFLMVFGSLLALVPTLMIALSPRHQALRSGEGYLSVYVSDFGMLLLLLGILMLALKYFGEQKRKYVLAIFGAAFVSVGLINLWCNRIVIEEANLWERYPRNLLEAALEHGLFDKVPPGALILTIPNNFWETPYLYYGHTKNKIRLLELAKIANDKSIQLNTDLSSNQIFIIKYSALSDELGYVFLSQVMRITPYKTIQSGNAAFEVTVRNIRAFKKDVHQQYNYALVDSNQNQKPQSIPAQSVLSQTIDNTQATYIFPTETETRVATLQFKTSP